MTSFVAYQTVDPYYDITDPGHQIVIVLSVEVGKHLECWRFCVDGKAVNTGVSCHDVSTGSLVSGVSIVERTTVWVSPTSALAIL